MSHLADQDLSDPWDHLWTLIGTSLLSHCFQLSPTLLYCTLITSSNSYSVICSIWSLYLALSLFAWTYFWEQQQRHRLVNFIKKKHEIKDLGWRWVAKWLADQSNHWEGKSSLKSMSYMRFTSWNQLITNKLDFVVWTEALASVHSYIFST